MRWAMALDDSFTIFENEFHAKRIQLVSNYRSSPDLVRIQHEIALAVDENSEKVEPKGPQDSQQESCLILEFSTPQKEAEWLTNFIRIAISEEVLNPRDLVILVRQRSSEYSDGLASSFRGVEVKPRDESELQDLLAERLSDIVISFLRLGSQKRGGKYWIECNRLLSEWNGITANIDSSSQLQADLAKFASALSQNMEILPSSKAQLFEIVDSILQFLGEDSLKLILPEYSQGDWYIRVIDRLVGYLLQYCERGDNWQSALDRLEGVNSVPLMTIHKSKGLEYHTVVFLALDDQAWWTFRKQPQEGRSTFFVAFSRAKERIVFTYCKRRADRRDVSSLYELLQTAGVPSRFVS